MPATQRLPRKPRSRVSAGERTAPLYPEPRDKGCGVELLASPPSAPYQALAQITIRGDESQRAEMREKLKEKACSLGADAVITMMDSSTVRLDQEVWREWMRSQAPHLSIKEYSLSLIGIAIVYKGPEAYNADLSLSTTSYAAWGFSPVV